MSHTSPKLLQKRLKIGLGVTEAAAIQACEEACHVVGLAVVSRADHHLVSLPLPSRSILHCMMPGRALAMHQDPSSGRGVCAEIVPSSSDEGRLAVSVAADRAGKKGKAFVRELRARLQVCAYRARTAGAADVAAAKLPTTNQESSIVAATGSRVDSAGYYAVSRLLCDHRVGCPGIVAAEFVETFNNKHVAMDCRPACGTSDERLTKEHDLPMGEIKVAALRICSLAEEVLVKPATADAAFVAAEMARSTQAERGTRLRIAIERYLFARVGATLWQHYTSLHSETDAHYARKMHALRAVPDATLLRELEAIPAFFGVAYASSDKHTNSFAQRDVSAETESGSQRGMLEDNSNNTDEAADSVELDDEDTSRLDSNPLAGRSDHSIRRAVSSLSRVEELLSGAFGSTPWEAFEALAIAHCELRTWALEASGGIRELSSIDDILPLFVFILVRSSILCPLACAQLMSDVFSAEDKESEAGQIVTVMGAAARYVTNVWDISGFCEIVDMQLESCSNSVSHA